ncbi:MAG: diacylglycerol kinase family protein [Bacteroidota bacterium]
MKHLFLINPLAGKIRHPAKVTTLIHSVYSKLHTPYEIQLIHFDQLASDIHRWEEQGVERIYVVGGDGSINAVAQHLIHGKIALGIIPGGSGNGLSRHLGLPLKLEKALREAPSWVERDIDTGIFRDQPFINLAGVGLDAEVSRAFSRSKKRGLLPYIRLSTQGLLHPKPIDVSMTIEGKTHRFNQILGVTIANGTQWGYEAKIAGGSSLTDGLLDVRVIHRFPLALTAPIVLRLFLGSLHQSAYISVFKAAELSLAGSLDTIQVDGEPHHGFHTASVKVQAASLRVAIPVDREI